MMFLPALLTMGLGMAAKYMSKPQQSPALPKLPGPTDAEVLASDQRIRRRLGSTGRPSNMISGGLADTTAQLSMPSLVGM